MKAAKGNGIKGKDDSKGKADQKGKVKSKD